MTCLCQKINDEITKIGSTKEVIIAGDLNSRVGQKVNNKVVGPHGEITQSNHGERFIQIFENHQLKITNGFFKHKEIHKYTWIQVTRNLKSIIDYVITKQNTLHVMDTRVYRGVSCDSDHFMVKSEIVFPFRSKKTKEPPEDTEIVKTTNYNLDSLQHESTRTLYQRRLNEKLVDIIENVSVEEMYKNIIDSVQTAAKEALGLKSQRHK
ncbi:uncharacterized protein [Diabrotica undecimpunctata]|uniref:uncharacterized protein n=1 Tax=Diabrotica undecimpunctata TaxID=50387 RepID=UPI003B635D66